MFGVGLIPKFEGGTGDSEEREDVGDDNFNVLMVESKCARYEFDRIDEEEEMLETGVIGEEGLKTLCEYRFTYPGLESMLNLWWVVGK